MNYEVAKNLSKEQLTEKKRKMVIPEGPYQYQKDILDEMLDAENKMVFNFETQNYHDEHCKLKKSENIEQCCWP